MPICFQFLGVILSGFSLRLLGRKNSLILSNLLHLVPLMMFLSDVDLKYDFAAAMMLHVAWRFQSPIINIYIAEVSEPILRALFVGFSYITYRVGYYANELQPAFSKPLASLSLFSAVACVVASVQAVESPYWLALKGKQEKAEKAYEWLRGAGSATSDEASQLFDKAAEDIEQLRRGLIANVFSLRFGIPLLVIVFLYLCDIDLVVLHQDTYFKWIVAIHFYDESYDKPYLFGKTYYVTLQYGLPILGAVLFCLLCVFVGRRILFVGSMFLNLALFSLYLFVYVPTYIQTYSLFFTYTGTRQVPGILASEVSNKT